jgi:outer membrane murein-binding lipoprotein Lpp
MGTLAKTSSQLLVDLINSDNGTSFAYNELVLSPPQVNDVVNNNRNTFVVVTSSDEFSFQGDETMYYNRIDFAALFQGLTVTVGGQGVTDVSGLLPEINATYGLGLTMDDILDLAVPSTGYPISLTLMAAPGSYAYIGQFTVQVQDIPPTISNNLSTTVLGNIGSDATNLWQNIWDVRKLSASIIQMNLQMFRHHNFVRALAQDFQQEAQVAIQQALEIGQIDDALRSLRYDLTQVQGQLAGVPSPQVLNTITSNISTLQSQVSTLQSTLTADNTALQAGITTNSNAIAALQTSKMSAPTQGSVTITTSSTSQYTGEISLAKLAILLSMSTDVPCRVRLYPNATERDADLSRQSTTPAPAGIGQLFEGITTPTLLTFYTGPTPFLYNGDSPADDNIAYTIEPTTPGVANVTLKYYSLLQ